MQKVNIPILPTYIDRIIITLLATLNAPVMPVDKPTVAKAEISSNKSCWVENLPCSIQQRTKNETTTQSNPINKVEAARRMVFLVISLRETTTSSFCRTVATAARSSTTKVVVLTPPPVLAGLAPININTTDKT